MPEFVYDHESSGAVSIKVIGVGGGGCNAVDSCFERGLANVEFYVINSDLQALKRSKCPNRIQIGLELTKGRGCGADPKLGEQCMLDAKDLIVETLQNTELVFITAGMGGGTGTGAGPVVAQIAREMGILTVGVVTTPFKFEGAKRPIIAQDGLERMREYCDTMIVVNNNQLLNVIGPKVPFREAFSVADTVLANAVQAISDLIATPCLINLDFNDVRSVMGGRGGAVMGIGVGKGENRATEAVKKATNSPLLDKLEIDGATGVLICITGGEDMTLSEIDEAVSLVGEMADPNVDIIFGAGEDPTLKDQMRVTLIATGFREDIQLRREAEEKRKANFRSRHSSSSAIGGNGSHREAAPAARRQPEADISIPFLDEMESEPVLPPKAQELRPPSRPAPSAETQRPAESRGSSLRNIVDVLMQSQDEAPTPSGATRVPTSPEPGYIVAPSGMGRSQPAPQPVQQHPAGVRPASAPAPVRVAPSSTAHARMEESNANVHIFDPMNQEAPADSRASNDYNQPAFMRKKRGMFD